MIPDKVHKNDKALTTESWQNNYRGSGLVWFSQVQYSLQVIYISDITEGNGEKYKQKLYTRKKRCQQLQIRASGE